MEWFYKSAFIILLSSAHHSGRSRGFGVWESGVIYSQGGQFCVHIQRFSQAVNEKSNVQVWEKGHLSIVNMYDGGMVSH